MTPKHSLAVDPLLLHMLGLLDRVSLGEEPEVLEERLRVRALLDQGEAIVGARVGVEQVRAGLLDRRDAGRVVVARPGMVEQ